MGPAQHVSHSPRSLVLASVASMDQAPVPNLSQTQTVMDIVRADGTTVQTASSRVVELNGDDELEAFLASSGTSGLACIDFYTVRFYCGAQKVLPPF
jgi:hypothetical protein